MNVDLAQVGPAQSPILCFHFRANGRDFPSNFGNVNKKRRFDEIFEGKCEAW